VQIYEFLKLLPKKAAATAPLPEGIIKISLAPPWTSLEYRIISTAK
jgi:hypothetical protein